MSTRRRGFAMIIAITLLGLVAATLAMLATHFFLEAQRTRTHNADAQVRQLLIAGQAVARAQADSLAAGKSIEVPLPPQLTQQQAKLTIAGAPANIQITAEYQARRASQQITLARDGTSWKLASAELLP